MKAISVCISVFVVMLSLTVEASSAQTGLGNRLIDERLRSLSSAGGETAVDCGDTSLNRAGNKPAACVRAAVGEGKPFRVLYSGLDGFFYSAYGLAGDAAGNVYSVEYDSRGLLNLGLRKRARVFDGNRIRVTTCMKPVRLGSAGKGIIACITPVNERQSQAAAEQKVIETTVCAIFENPAAFNNKLVRVHGHASGNFEYSELSGDGCSDALWFAYGNGEGPPTLAMYIMGGARPGAEDERGRIILPIPVKLKEDSNFDAFQRLMFERGRADDESFKANPTKFTSHRVAATFIGRIDAVSDDIRAFHAKRKIDDKVDYLGFGQMGLFDAQFVMQSVEGDAVLEGEPGVPVPPEL